MKIHTLAVLITKREGKKKQVNIAQVKEILKVLNSITYGAFYKWVRYPRRYM